MSNPNSGNRRIFATPTVPSGITLATYPTYDEARAAIDALNTASFPVQQVSIIGEGLRSVERVTGALSWGKAALSGLVSGLWFGFFLGMLMVIWAPESSASSAYLTIALMLGGAFGILTGLLRYAVTRRQRSFTSITQVIASTYVLIAPAEVASEAIRILGTAPRL